jgi:methionine synthase II (cobalamin-independent)
MKRSTDRILTTHVGSLIRPPELLEFLKAEKAGRKSMRMLMKSA